MESLVGVPKIVFWSGYNIPPLHHNVRKRFLWNGEHCTFQTSSQLWPTEGL